jgi:hypothetical protein
LQSGVLVWAVGLGQSGARPRPKFQLRVESLVWLELAQGGGTSQLGPTPQAQYSLAPRPGPEFQLRMEPQLRAEPGTSQSGPDHQGDVALTGLLDGSERATGGGVRLVRGGDSLLPQEVLG